MAHRVLRRADGDIVDCDVLVTDAFFEGDMMALSVLDNARHVQVLDRV